MDARRLLLIFAAGAIAALLAQGLTGHHQDEEVARSVVRHADHPRADRTGRPGEVVWANWENTPPSSREQASPAVRDVAAGEMRYEDLPDRVRERIERDFKGLDVALPRRTAVREREER